jgi:ribonuclease R
MGARVRVQVSRVDLDGRKIDFRMVREGEADRLMSKGHVAKAERAVDKVDSAAAELAAVKQADRLARGGARAAKAAGAAQGGKGGSGAGGGRPARSRKPGPQRPAPKARARR